VKNPLWNAEQRRVRALWRLLVQGLLFLVLATILSGLALLAGLSIALASGRAMPSPADPDFAQELAEMAIGDPLVGVLFMLASFVSIFVSVWAAGRVLDRRPLADLGFHFSHRWWADLGFGLGLGAVLMVGIFILELAAGWVTVTGTLQSPQGPFGAAILMALVHFVGVGIQEELLSRGYHLRNMAEGLNLPSIGARGALLLGYAGSSVVFGLLHAANPNASVVSTINLVVAGLFLGLGYVLTGELAIPIGLHITWNFFQGNVFGFPVSGGASTTSFIAIEQGGPELWTGGAFGPEAGLMGLLAIGLGSLLTVVWVRRQYGRAELQDRLARYTRRQPQAGPPAESEAVDGSTELTEVRGPP
jgi:membrane protease YdiL (CAAX protease family)